MMMLKMITVLTLCLAAASTAAAQIDTDPDGIGLYADLEATMNSIDAAIWTPFDIYLIATNITAEDIQLWGCTFSMDDGIYVDDWAFLQDYYRGYSSIPELAWATGGGQDCAVLAVADAAIPLLRLTLLVTDPGEKRIAITSGLVVGEPVYYSSEQCFNQEEGTPLTPSSGALDEPCFVINGQAPVANEGASWSRLKALYR